MKRTVFPEMVAWLPAVALASAGAAMLTPSAVTAAAAVAATPAPAWAVDQKVSRLGFQSSEGGTAFGGAFTRWQASIRFDPKNLAGSSVVVNVDMASARTGSSERDEALPSEDWFAASRFARATYAARAFKDLGGGRFQALGTLSMRGVSRPLVLPFTLDIRGSQARMTGSVTIDRHAFGVGQGQYATPDSVPFGVKVNIVLAARRI